MGADDYREGALLRLADAQILYDAGQWVGCVYLAGRAVQCILRSLLWARSSQQHVGHSLPQMLDEVRRVGFLRERDFDGFDSKIDVIAVVWRNDLRFTGLRRFERLLKQGKRDQFIGQTKVTGDASKANAKSVLEATEWVVQRGEPLCKRR